MITSISNVLKIPKNPKRSYINVAKSQLNKAHSLLIASKMQRSEIQLGLLREDSRIKSYMVKLYPVLEDYLDVRINLIEVIPGSQLDPVTSISILGHTDDVVIASRYIEYIYKTTEALVNNYRDLYKKKAKQARRKNRRGTLHNRQKPYLKDDCRTNTSKYRKNIVDKLLNQLRNLLEQYRDYSILYLKANHIRTKIKDYEQYQEIC